jgi:DNA-binding beta-propeller fold protein YncE
MSSMPTVPLRLLALAGAAALAATTCQRESGPGPDVAEAVSRAVAQSSFTLFESGQVRPLALAPDGKHLFAVNTPDGKLEIFRVRHDGLRHVGAVTVGLEPVAVAVSGSEAWVVNHLSDSISVVDVSDPRAPRVARTLLVGDEPRDVVFAGPGRRRAFITAAHRGQNTGRDPQLTTPSVGRADVWVFDADHLGNALGGTPLTVVSLFADTPRGLAVTPDGSRVYAAGYHSGNQTTTIPSLLVHAPGAPGAPPPLGNYQGIPAPATGLIARWNGAHWVDERGLAWDDAVKFSLPDRDVFSLDANASPPVERPEGAFAHVGTVLFNLAVNPVSGRIYASNLESRNHVRFEGPGVFAGHPGVQGHTAESRITVLDPASAAVTPRHLNPHIDYSHCCAPLPSDENERSLAFPTGMVVSGDGATLYVAALGSSKLGVYATAALEAGTFVPHVDHQIPLSGGGPTGLVLDEPRGLLYVFTRFDNSISVVDAASRAEIAHVPLYSPEPPAIVEGRRFLYDARHTSSHGDSACASCHIFGDMDSLAWDLGNPDGDVVADPGPFDNDPTQIAGFGGTVAFHPMKGPMVTQSLRGLANHGPMHWRGDRTGGNDHPSVQPDSGSFDERLAFQKFNPAFVSLVGRSAPLPDAEMERFTDFVLRLAYPPNPIRNLDDSDTPEQAAARAFYLNVEASSFLAPSQTCDSCHRLDPGFNAQYGVAAPGVFGSDNQYSFLFNTQVVKNVHLRNQYQKVGMFGAPAVPVVIPGDNGFMGDQIRGFGFMHDGEVDTVFRFFKTVLFNQQPGNPNGIPVDAGGDATRRAMESFMFAFPTNLKPIVGQQITLTHANRAVTGPRVDLLEQRAAAGDCDLIAKARLGGRERGFLYAGGGFLTDVSHAPKVPDALLRALAAGPQGAVTFTCVPPGSGARMGLDRDLDGVLDGDEPDDD